MKGGTVQINWHLTKPVLSLDFHPLSSTLATAGADFDIKLWLISSADADNKIPIASYQNSLSHHSSAVNVVRFSPSGEQLASGADGGELLIWKLYPSETGQTWKVFKTLAFHRKDVLDLEWSTDGAFLISGSVDNSCLIWDANKGSVHQILDAHFHYVQGVAWDPLSKYAASLSSDRTCRIYVNKPQGKTKGPEKLNYVCQHVITKSEQPSGDDSKPTKSHLFHDETLPSFFRRLAWSPDGSFLLAPAGCYKVSPATETINTAYVFSRRDLSRPALQLPCASKPVIAVRFCPLRFSLRGSNSSGFFKLPYRLIFAVVTLNSLYIYDTESISPIAVLAGLHYAAITDIAWSSDARYLALSSQDGYCTLVEFENDELGSPILSEQKNILGDETRNPVQKPDDTEIEVAPNNGPDLERDKKLEAAKAEGKQTSQPCTSTPNNGPDVEKDMKQEAGRTEGKETIPSSNSTPSIANKPAKRRIIPIAIDPIPRYIHYESLKYFVKWGPKDPSKGRNVLRCCKNLCGQWSTAKQLRNESLDSDRNESQTKRKEFSNN